MNQRLQTPEGEPVKKFKKGKESVFVTSSGRIVMLLKK